MAEKKSQSRAEKAVSDVKRNTGASNSAKSAKKNQSSGKSSGNKKAASKAEQAAFHAPFSVIAAIVSAALFFLLVVLCVNPEGALLRFVKSLLLGLFGQAGFYFAIPACLYLFIINTFSRRSAVKMRSFCVISFVLLCGCLFHLVVQKQSLGTGFAVFKELYWGGNEGVTGGVLCGGIAMLLRWTCGTLLSYLICILGAMLTLLGSMQITVPSILRAIANRPRDIIDEEEEQEYIDPAALMVNHIANKKIEQKRQRRQQEAVRLQELQNLPQAVPQQQKPEKKHPKQVAAEEPVQQPIQVEAPSGGTPSHGASMMSTIDLDISAPMFGKQKPSDESRQRTKPAVPVAVEGEDLEVVVPSRMPKLDMQKPTRSVKMEKKTPSRNEEPPQEVKKEKVTAKEAEESARQVAVEISKNEADHKNMYCFPPIDLLKSPVRGSADGTEEMRENSRRLNETLASFKIDAHIINVTRGPSVTRYEVELDKGVRLNKLTGCADDIALSLGASGVRIAAVPGKISIVGIEVPNRNVTTVSLRDVIDSSEFARAKSKSSFAVGKDIGGSCIVGNIAKMPHMLIAGTTGSGKSVCMNSIIISLLYKAGPEDVKLIMVDPKMVELGIYNGIPHLLIPVVTDPKKAAGSLQWAVTEMMRRYKMMSDVGVRDLESYNSIMMAEDGQKLPSVVVIIDELADLMMVAAKEVEDSICRIAQMGRAAGMHLIIATQRPSADVITGLMKANIPSRIAFSVASAMESRIILDTMGAEKLVGKGDMLYSPIGSGKPLRVQGCFVTDTEVEAVAGYVKEHYVADYNQDVLKEIEKQAQQAGKKTASVSEPEPSDAELDGDEMLPAAVDVILETGQASVSMLQRRLKLGYARAARIVDEMEEKGIVGPFQGSKPRSILITKEQWELRKNGGEVEQMDFDDLEEIGEENF